MSEPGAGARLGRYRLLAPIGSGGMGRVWAAMEEGAAERHILAIKLALNEEGADTKYWTALSDEANVAARIRHPNVCATHGLGTQGEVRFLVMDWSDGASLRDLMDALPGKRLPVAAAAQIGAKVASGLQAAHQLTDDNGESLNVVHRDVSPQNVLIDRRGRVRLADFGVAKARGQLRRATETGEIKGKLSYMAPEQIASKQVDARADVFALACVIYEAALGVRAFQGGDALTTMYSILEEAPRAPSGVDPTFPPRFEAVLLKALEKDPARRYQSAAELQDAFNGCLDEDLTAPGDRHIAKLLETTLGAGLSSRNDELLALAERVERGEELSPPLTSPPTRTHSLTAAGVSFSNEQPIAHKRNRNALWLGVAAVGGVCVLLASLFGHRAGSSSALGNEAATLPTSSLAAVVSAAVPEAASAASTESSATALAPPAGSNVHEAPPSRPHPKRPAAGAPTSTPVAETPAPSGELPKRKPVKVPRTIDQSNPFTN